MSLQKQLRDVSADLRRIADAVNAAKPDDETEQAPK
jgi:hypothetical protein